MLSTLQGRLVRYITTQQRQFTSCSRKHYSLIKVYSESLYRNVLNRKVQNDCIRKQFVSHKRTRSDGVSKQTGKSKLDPGQDATDFTIGRKALFAAVFVPAFGLGGIVMSVENQSRNRPSYIYDQRRFKFRDNQSLRAQINTFWNSLSQGQKLVCTIFSTNLAVFLAWRIPALQNVMLRYFTTTAVKGNSATSLLFSAFSHMNLFHFGMNMYVMSDFIPLLSRPSSQVSLPSETVLGFYLSAAVFSGFISCLHKYIRRVNIPSVGASGAILGCLGLFAMASPNSQFCVPFIVDIYPHSFSASAGLKGLIALDTTGIILGWRFLDHAGHLGGVMFGICFYYFIKKYGSRIVTRWRRFRSHVE